MNDEYPELREAATDAAFAALEAAADAAIWAAIALYPDYPLHREEHGTPAAVDAAHRVVNLAERLIHALHRYRAVGEEDSEPDESFPF
jgi:hypothetical protein